MWQGGPYTPPNAKNVATRLKEVHSLRTLHKQLTQLLSHSEQDELKTSEAFEAFKNVNAIQYNPYTEPIWKSAIKHYPTVCNTFVILHDNSLTKTCILSILSKIAP